MVEAVARSAAIDPSDVRRAQMLAGDLAAVARVALTEGRAGLREFKLELGRPLQPMLAQSAETVSAAMERTGPAALEWKLDGARLQIHKDREAVRAFTRNLAEVTHRVPEIVDSVSGFEVDAIVLDCEVIALGNSGKPRPFQTTMSRFGSKLDIEHLRTRTPLSLFAFDCLHASGTDLLDRPQKDRYLAMTELVPKEFVVPHLITDGLADAEAFYEDALDQGHEGVMVKALDGLYQAGRRGATWVKVKRVHTLDLVVLAAEWGHGRRRGWLSNLHLGARDPKGGFVMLGKTFKGMTDEILTWQTEQLLARETGRSGHVVFVKPELVVEVAFDGLQTSTRYEGGLALRFARIKGYRPDRSAEDAATIETVRALHVPND
jgi:DNA ligase-1